MHVDGKNVHWTATTAFSLSPPQQSGCLGSFLLQQLQKTMGGGSQKKYKGLGLQRSFKGISALNKVSFSCMTSEGNISARGKYSCEAVRSVCLPLFSHRWAHLHII